MVYGLEGFRVLGCVRVEGLGFRVNGFRGRPRGTAERK